MGERQARDAAPSHGGGGAPWWGWAQRAGHSATGHSAPCAPCGRRGAGRRRAHRGLASVDLVLTNRSTNCVAGIIGPERPKGSAVI